MRNTVHAQDVILLAVFSLSTCSPANEAAGPIASGRAPGDSVLPGVLVSYGDQLRTDIPAIASVGDSILISIKTYGVCGTRKAETRVTQQATLVEIRPFDITVPVPANAMCVLLLHLIDHRATIRASAPGTLTVRIIGRQLPADNELTIERHITIR